MRMLKYTPEHMHCYADILRPGISTQYRLLRIQLIGRGNIRVQSIGHRRRSRYRPFGQNRQKDQIDRRPIQDLQEHSLH